MSKPNIEALVESGDTTTAIIELDNYVSQLCEYGERLDELSAPQRVFFLNQNFEREVNNGGFHQFFFNSSGDNAEETIGALEVIGANKNAELLRQAIARFPDGKVLKQLDERQVLMLNIFDGVAFNDLDEKFFAYEEPLTDLNFNWIRKNADGF